jgi:septal ring factor EnvC (AmiA/AmiB activator)
LCVFAVAIAGLVPLSTAQESNTGQPTSIKAERARLRKLEVERQARQKTQIALESEAQALRIEIQQSTSKMVDVAAQIQNRERKLDVVEEKLDVLAAERARQLGKLNQRRSDVLGLLAALQNLTRQPPQLLLVRPGAAIDTARSATLLKLVVPQLETQTAALRKDIDDLAVVKDKLDTERETYRIELASLTADRKTLDALRLSREAKRSQLLERADDESEKAQALAAEARDVKQLLERLEKAEAKRLKLARLPGPRLRPDFSKPPPRVVQSVPPRSATGPGRTLPRPPQNRPPIVSMTPRAVGNLPVRGDIITTFGASTPNGPARGLSIRSRADATVTAPAPGRVVFSGPFRAYGQMLIISHGEGYHSLIAGLSRLDAKNQQLVQAGEPVGVMGADGDGSTLYYELRRGGDAINPLSWLTASRR